MASLALVAAVHAEATLASQFLRCTQKDWAMDLNYKDNTPPPTWSSRWSRKGAEVPGADADIWTTISIHGACLLPTMHACVHVFFCFPEVS